MAFTIPAPHPVHSTPDLTAHAFSALNQVRRLVDALELAALREGRSLAGSPAADVPPLSEATACTTAARTALFHALDALIAGGAR